MRAFDRIAQECDTAVISPAPEPPCTHWECALMGAACVESGAPAMIPPTLPEYSDLPAYRRADVEWDREALHLFATLPEMTADNRLQAALMRDALLTPAEYAARRAITLDRLRRTL